MAGLGSMGVVPAAPVTAFQQGQQAAQMQAMRGQQITAMHLHNLMTLGKLHDTQVEAQSYKTALAGAKGNSPTDMYNAQVKAGILMGQGGDVGGMLRTLDAAQKSRTAQFDQAYKATETAVAHTSMVQKIMDQLSAQTSDVHNQAQWDAWNQQVAQMTGGPSPFAQIPYSPAAVKSAQDMAMSLNHQIAMKKDAAMEAMARMRIQQGNERLSVARQKLALLQHEAPGHAAEQAARVKELEAQQAHYEGELHGAVLHPHKISGTDAKVAAQALQTQYPHMNITANLADTVAERAQSLMDAEHMPQEQAMTQAVKDVHEQGGFMGLDTSGTLSPQESKAASGGYLYQGHSFTASQVESAAKAAKMTVPEYVKKYDLTQAP